MITGIYRLDFSSGAFYIGKSIDIIERWRQHSDKFKKGTASKLMQSEYDLCGMPEGTVIKECHADHIDIVEACFINRLRPQLNGTYPDDPLAELNTEELHHFLDNIDDSTVDHLNTIKYLKSQLVNKDVDHKILSDQYKEAILVRSKREIDRDYETRISELERSLRIKSNLLDMYKDEIEYLSLPWYKKLF